MTTLHCFPSPMPNFRLYLVLHDNNGDSFLDCCTPVQLYVHTTGLQPLLTYSQFST